MEQRIDTSFIPQRPIFKEEAGIRRHEPIPVVTLLGFAVFFAALVLTGVSFFFEKKAAASVESLKIELGKADAPPSGSMTIDKIRGISDRLKIAKGIVDGHLAISPLLDLIQALTMKSVYYTSLELRFDPERGYVLDMQGKAPSFGLLYSQIATLRAEPRIHSVTVMNLTLDDMTGHAGFDIDILLAPEIMKYVPPSASVQSTDASIPTTQTP